MMSFKEWLVLLCGFLLFLMLGACLFHTIEGPEEDRYILRDIGNRKRIQELLWNNYQGNNRSIENLFKRLTDYCGKPVHYHMSDDLPDKKWNFYNAIFFVITIVSTIGYGNLSPTTMFTRIFMILYGLIGIPMSGIVLVTLGDFFGRSFTKLYERWKKLRLEKNTAKLGLIGQIILYAVPGLTFFIFLPATIMSFFEGWEYDVSVYYSFVTLTTIGFGDYVAGTKNLHQFHPWVFQVYHVFLLVWVIGGLGYVIMIIGFITKGMRSRKIAKLEKLLSQTVKRTPVKIRNEIRSLLQEVLFMRVKPVYKGEFVYNPHQLERTQSCPDFTIWRNVDSPTMGRKRAMSECYKYNVLERVQSESELDKIDKERTFRPSDALMKQKDLLLKVVDALSLASTSTVDDKGVQGFSDEEILASERYQPPQILPVNRRRAVSDVKPPTEYITDESVNTWYGNDASRALKAFKQKRQRAMSVFPTVDTRLEKNSVIQRFQKTVANKFRRNEKEIDVEKQILEEPKRVRSPSIVFSNSEATSLTRDSNVLENTSIAEFIRALSAVTQEDTFDERPKRKIGVASLTPPSSENSPLPQYRGRRTSLIPPTRVLARPRRFSMTPVAEHISSSEPPPYSPSGTPKNSVVLHGANTGRRFSIRPVATSGAFTSIKSQLLKRKNIDSEKDSKG